MAARARTRSVEAVLHARPEQNQATTSTAGAARDGSACLVSGWKPVRSSLASHVIRDTDCGARPTALADLAAQAHPSAVVHSKDLAKTQPGPHGGAGNTTAYPFFADAPGMPFQFRKRALHKGAGIGLHQHDKAEIYYVISGRGRYVLDGKVYDVGVGDAMLTRPGSTHSLQQTGDEDLVILITYLATPKP